MLSSSPRLSNHLAAPVTASFVASMRQAFGKVEVLHVSENTVLLGNKTNVIEQKLVTYSKARTVRGKTIYSLTEFTVGRLA